MITTEPLTTQVLTYPDTRDLVGQVQSALTELASRADAPRVEDTHLRAQIEQHQRWIARRDLGQQIVDRIDPRTTARGAVVNGYDDFAGLRMPRPEEPMPAPWHRALEVVGALVDERRTLIAADEKQRRADRDHKMHLHRALNTGGDSTQYDDLNVDQMVCVLERFVDDVRSALVEDGQDVSPDGLNEISTNVAAQHAELVALRARWAQVPLPVREHVLSAEQAVADAGQADRG